MKERLGWNRLREILRHIRGDASMASHLAESTIRRVDEALPDLGGSHGDGEEDEDEEEKEGG